MRSLANWTDLGKIWLITKNSLGNKIVWIITKIWINLGKIWAKSKSCIPKKIRSLTAMALQTRHMTI